MTLDEARSELESLFPAWPEIGNNVMSATAQYYVEICSGGMKEDGERFPCLCATEEIAVDLWLDACKKYASDKSGTLYWRETPVLDSFSMAPCDEGGNVSSAPELRAAFARKVFVVYSRFLISDKPVVRPAAIERKAS